MQQPQQQQTTFNQNYYQLQRQQQATPAQPIRLSHPTPYHVKQTELRNRRELASSNDGAPPTPNNSFTNTVDPSLLSNTSFQLIPHHIKQESNPPDNNDLEFGDPSSTIMSPLSNSSPLGSPPNNTFDDEYSTNTRTFKAGGNAAVHIDTASQLGESPGTQPSIYSPGPDNTDFLFEPDFSTSAPTSASAMDMKPMGTAKFAFNRLHANNGFANQVQPISMSLPVYSNNANAQTEWYNAGLEPSSFAGGHSSLFGSATEMPLLTEYINPEDENAEKRQLIYEKRRRRRESHNAVERRRRDNINEKIQELSTLLPDLYNDSTNKPNKGVILTKSVNYIRSLNARNQELEAAVRNLQSKLGTDGNAPSSLGDDEQSSAMNLMS